MNIKKFYEINEEIELPGMSGDVVDSWINVKIDRDLPLRISRYARALDVYAESDDLEGKLEILSNPDMLGKYGVQCKLSIVILLQYLKEIRNNFEASSSGFLFEDFIAGLLHSKRYGGQKGYDFVDSYGKKSQIKFYSEKTSQIRVRSKIYDYYIIGIKLSNENAAKIWIIRKDKNIDNYVVPYYEGDKVSYRQINMTLLKKEERSGVKIPYYLSFDNLETAIERVSDNLKDFVKALYGSISELNYNIETIITGVDNNQNVIRVSNLDKYYKKADKNIRDIQDQVLFVKNEISDLVKKYK